MKNNNTLYAVSARIPTETYERLSKLTALTKKATAALVHDALVEYLELVYNPNYKPSKALRIDRYAVEIERK
jgi:predicted DNA-binding protein